MDLLDDSAARLAAIISSSDDAIVGKDLNGIVLSWNAAAERLFGYTAAEAIGKPITIIIPPDRYHEEDFVLSRVRAGLGVSHYETVRFRKDGSPIDISLTVSPIRTLSGEIIGVSKIARDITEQKRLRREADQASRLKDEFLATLSHELRTPLNTVLGYVSMLRSGTLTEEKQAKALEVVQRNAEALMQLVSDLTDTSRIMAGKLRLQLAPCDVGALVVDSIDSLGPAIAARRLDVRTDLDSDLQVFGDGDRLRQVFWNLLSNAVKFTPPGGRITVSARRSGTSISVAVHDTGIGISAEVLPCVFQRFWQAESVQSRDHGGLGLGLALVRHLLDLHGGTVRAASEGVGTGATFVVELPVSGPEPAAVPPAGGTYVLASPDALHPPDSVHNK